MQLASDLDRPIHLVLRGGIDLAEGLSRAFASVTVLESTSFMKTVNRQVAVGGNEARIRWVQGPTDKGACITGLLEHNFSAVRRQVRHGILERY
jgi:hypothetical protein